MVVIDPHVLVAANGLQAIALVTEDPVADRPIRTLHDEIIEIRTANAQCVTLLGGVEVLTLEHKRIEVEHEVAAASFSVAVDQEAKLGRAIAVARQFEPGRLDRIEAVKRGASDGRHDTVCVSYPFPIDHPEGAMIGIQPDGEIPEGHRGRKGHSPGKCFVAVVVDSSWALIDASAAVIDRDPIVHGDLSEFPVTLDGGAKLLVRCERPGDGRPLGEVQVRGGVEILKAEPRLMLPNDHLRPRSIRVTGPALFETGSTGGFSLNVETEVIVESR